MRTYSLKKSLLVNSMQAISPLISRKLDIDHLFIRKGQAESITDVDSSGSDVARHIINSVNVTFSQKDLSDAALELINGTNSGNLVVRITGSMGNQTIVSSNTLNKTAETLINDVNSWVNSLVITDPNLAFFVRVTLQHAIVKAFAKAGLLSNYSKSVSIITVKDAHVVPSTIDMANDLVVNELCNIADIVISTGLSEAPRQKCSKGDISQFILLICRKFADEIHKLIDLYSNIGLLLSVVDYSIENVFSYDLFYPTNDVNLVEIIDEVRTGFNFLYVSDVAVKHPFIKPMIRVDNTNHTASFVHEVAYRFPTVKALFKKLLTLYQRVSLVELKTSLCYSFTNDHDDKLQSINFIDPVKSAIVPQLLSSSWLTVSPIPRNNSFKAVMPSSINEAFDQYSINKNILALLSPRVISDCYNELARFKSETKLDNYNNADNDVNFVTVSNLSLHDQYAFKLALAIAMATETILVPDDSRIHKVDPNNQFYSDLTSEVADDTETDAASPSEHKYNLLLSRGRYRVLFKIGEENNTMIRNAFDSTLSFPSGSFTDLVEAVLAFFIPKTGLTNGVMSCDNSTISSIITNIGARFNPSLTILSSHNVAKKDIKLYKLNKLSMTIATLAGSSQGKFNNLKFEVDLGTVSLLTPNMDEFAFLSNFGCYHDFDMAVRNLLNLISDLNSTVSNISTTNVLANADSVKAAVIKRVLDPLFRSLKSDCAITKAVETYIANESYRLAYNSDVVSDYVRQDILGGIDSLLNSGFGSSKAVLTFMITSYFMLAFVQHSSNDYKSIKDLVNTIISHTVVSFN